MTACVLESFKREVTVIIEYFEVKLENLQVRWQMFSNYKHGIVHEFIIVIAPHGMFILISKAYKGRLSEGHNSKPEYFIRQYKGRWHYFGWYVISGLIFINCGFRCAWVKIPHLQGRKVQVLFAQSGVGKEVN